MSTQVFRYVSTARTVEEVEAWAEREGLQLVVIERALDGLLRGIAREPEKSEAQP